MTLLLLAIVAFAGLIHAGFQVSVGALTLLSGHALGRKTRHAHLLRMVWAYVLGCALFTAMLLASVVLLAKLWLPLGTVPSVVWVLLSGGLIGLGAAVWSVYYRATPGTALWVPHGIASYVTKRATTTRSSVEAFSLGMSTLVLELLFIAGPVVAVGLLLCTTSPSVTAAGIAVYSLLATSGTITVACLLGSGRSVSQIQKWRADNKRFLQFVSGAGLMALGAYLYVEHVLGGIVV